MLRFLGGVLLAGLVVAGAFMGWIFWLDRQASPAAERHMKLLFTQWRYDDFEFLASDSVRADPQAQAMVKEMFPFLQQQLGELRELGELRGKAGVSWGDTPTGQGIVGMYDAEGVFQKARARVRLQLVRERGFWRVRGFWIEPVPLPGAAPTPA